MKKYIILIVIIVLAATGIVIWYGMRPVVWLHTENATTTPSTSTPAVSTSTTKTFATTSEDFQFTYPAYWHAHSNMANGVILLKAKEFPDIQSEIFALGDLIMVHEAELIGTYGKKLTQEEFINTITTEENVYEGKTTLSRWEKINGKDMFRVEHLDPNFQPTIAYYLFKEGGYYQIYHYPYDTVTDFGKKNYADFMNVVNTFTLVK